MLDTATTLGSTTDEVRRTDAVIQVVLRGWEGNHIVHAKELRRRSTASHGRDESTVATVVSELAALASFLVASATASSILYVAGDAARVTEAEKVFGAGASSYDVLTVASTVAAAASAVNTVGWHGGRCS